jgi:hypothetical protein
MKKALFLVAVAMLSVACQESGSPEPAFISSFVSLLF